MIEDEIFTRLTGDATITGLVGTKIYPGGAPQGIALPYVTYKRVSTDPVYTITGDNGLNDATYQIDAWSQTYSEAVSIADAIRARLEGWQDVSGTPKFYGTRVVEEDDIVASPVGGSDRFNYARSLDVAIWYSE